MALLTFDDDEAVRFGLDEAVFLAYVRDLLERKKTERNTIDNQVWLPLWEWELKFAFPFWKPTKISKIRASLLKQNKLVRKKLYQIARSFVYSVAK